MSNLLYWPLDLPCGATLSNRVAKAAMSEGLADIVNQRSKRKAPFSTSTPHRVGTVAPRRVLHLPSI